MRSRILVVARDVALRARLARLLKAVGHSVELAESAPHARRIGLGGFVVAVMAPDGLGPDVKALLAELDAQGAKVLALGVEPGYLDPADETGLLCSATIWVEERVNQVGVCDHACNYIDVPDCRWQGVCLSLVIVAR